MSLLEPSSKKQWWDPRDWGKTAEQVVEKHDILDTQKAIIDPDSHKDQIDAQQEAKTSYGLGNKSYPRSNGETLTYPQELFSASQPHAVHFYINARQTSVAAIDVATAAQENEEMRQRLIEENEKYNIEYTKENRAKAEEYETVATGAGALAATIGTMAGISSGNILKDGASKLGKVLTTAVGGIVGGVLGKAMASNTSTIRLLKTIQLYVPQSIVSAYAANWDETNLGVAGMLGSGRMDFKDLAEAPEFIGRGAITAAANLPKAIGADADFGAAIEASSKKVNNPYKEQLFKSMGFRRFSFNYTFAPRNIAEASQVMEIVDTFKYHMHPEASEGDLFLIYPAEFSIQFEYLNSDGKVDRNPHLPKISSCALTGCKVTYGPDGAFNTFRDSGGIPTEINMELAFTELETLTAVRIAQGF